VAVISTLFLYYHDDDLSESGYFQAMAVSQCRRVED